MPRPYALQVLSSPTKVSEDLWKQWYTEEHIRDIVYSEAATNGAVYSATSSPVTFNLEPSDIDTSAFLALYQSNHSSLFAACASLDRKCKVRIKSSLFPDGQSSYDVGIFKPQDLQLVEILGSYETREDVAPHILHHIIYGEGIENKIQFDHVNSVAELDGYRRTLLYRPVKGDGPGGAARDRAEAFVVLVHEFDAEIDEGGLPAVTRDLEAIEPTRGCKFSLRAYKLIESEGFDGRCRTPERMEQ